MIEREREGERARFDGSELDDEDGAPEVTDPRPSGSAADDQHERLLPPGSRPGRSTAFGITVEEQLEGPSLRRRLLEEEPDDEPEGHEDPPASRIVGIEDATADADVDEEPELIGQDSGDVRGLSAEEEAVRTTRDADAEPS